MKKDMMCAALASAYLCREHISLINKRLPGIKRRVMMVLAFFFVAISGAFVQAKEKPVVVRSGDKEGYKATYRSEEWLYPPVLDDGWAFKENDYAIIKRDGRYNVIDLAFNELLPEWSADIPDVAEGFIVIKVKGVSKVYDFGGRLRLQGYDIRPIMVERYGYNKSEKKAAEYRYGKALIGFTGAAYKGSPYGLIYPDFKTMAPLSSAGPVTCVGGLLLFTIGTYNMNFSQPDVTGGVVTDLECNEIGSYQGYVHLMKCVSNGRHVSEWMALEDRFGGFLPAYVLVADGNYESKGAGMLGSIEIVKRTGFKSIYGLNDKWFRKAVKAMSKPEVVDYYKLHIVSAAESAMAKARKMADGAQGEAKPERAEVMSCDGGFVFTADGVNPLPYNTTVYSSIDELGVGDLFVAKKDGSAALVKRNGTPLSNDGCVDYLAFGDGVDYFAGIRTDSQMALYHKSGAQPHMDAYSDIVLRDTPAGKVFYLLGSNGRWRAWAPGHSEIEPKMPFFDYVGEPDASGEVAVRYKGYPGTYNLFTGKSVSPEATLFNKAYKSADLSNAQRIALYRQVLVLENEFNEGYRGSVLNNIGAAYEESGNEDEAFEYYEFSKNAGNKTGESNWKRIRNSRRLQRIGAVANAIAGATGNMVAAMGGGSNGMESVSGYAPGYGPADGDSMNQGGSSSGSGYSESYYREQYSNWERRAEGAYNSLTVIGARTKEGSKEKSGSTLGSMSGSNYTRQKKCLREAQSEMRKIRTKASRDGVTIMQSHWETVTVSY